MPVSWKAATQKARLARAVRSYDLGSFIERTSPQFQDPVHLAPLKDALHAAFMSAAGGGKPVRKCVSVPPQHGKSQCVLHAMSHHLELRPQDMLAYISYNESFAQQQSRYARDYARIAGVDLRDDSTSKSTWLTTEGGGAIFRGIGGAITGQQALRLIVIDDPFRNRSDAESRVIRDSVYHEWQSTIASRLHPNTSVIVIHTRWHVDDLIGRLVKEGWDRINLPAIDDEGEALWEAVQNKDHLLSLRETVGEYAWFSLWQGEPRPRDNQLFQGVSYYTEIPPSHKIAIGVDLAYSARSASDWSVAVVLALANEQYYVKDVIRRQCSAPDFAETLKQLSRRYPGAPMRGYLAGTEKGSVDFFASQGIPLKADAPTADKFIRAQPVSAAWNNGRVLLPHGAQWLEPFLDTVLNFSGVNDRHDDDVDALAAAFDALSRGVVKSTGPLIPRRVRRGPWG